MSEQRDGQIITFYSYKGGTGRTMALANVAWILAANGKRVLVADWDLESPGLHRYFHPFIDKQAFASARGVIDLIREYEWATVRQDERAPGFHREYARVGRHALRLDWAFPGEGVLDFLSAGRLDSDYSASLAGMDWDSFYDRLDGGKFMDALRDDMKASYDYVLIDSRSGLSDVADICTIHLPDTLVDCFTYSFQAIEGAAQVASTIRERYGSRSIRVLPVPMRIDNAEKAKADLGLALAMRRFAGFPADMTAEERAEYWATVGVPYQSFYAYEEQLAVFGDVPGSPRSLLYAYEMLTRHLTHATITGLPPMDGALRARQSARFQRLAETLDVEIWLRFAADDQPWADWIAALLRSAGIRVLEFGLGAADERAAAGAARDMIIVSQSTLDTGIPDRPATADRLPSLLVYVSDVHPLPNVPADQFTMVSGAPAGLAARRILGLVQVNVEADPEGDPSSSGVRFPGKEPAVYGVPARNARFTGREDELRQLRERLHGGGTAAPATSTVALMGLGGVGKTQLAIEYAHRFRGAYDVVWWVNADPPVFIDRALADLATRLGVSTQPNVADAAQAALRSLEHGDPFARWLLIFDNAEDLHGVAPFLPRGQGHVLITSRSQVWGDRSRLTDINVFRRDESIALLRQRVPSMAEAVADQVAEALGDLPIALAAGGAWLAETGASAEEYLRQLQKHGPNDASVEATWDLSLARLQERSPAAFRLLQLCSVLGSEIALELVYSDELAAALVPFDPAVSDSMMRGSMVQQINRLALLKLDVQARRIHIHRLLQHVVRRRMSETELGEARQQVHLVLSASRPRGDVDDPVTWDRFRMLWPHLEISAVITSGEEGARQLLIDRTRYLWLRGELVEGRRLAETVVRAWTDLLAWGYHPQNQSIHRQLLHLQFQLANILRDQAEFSMAWELDEDVHSAQLHLLGPSHAHTLMTEGGLAADLRALGRYREAVARADHTRAAWVENFGEDNPYTLAAVDSLASSYRLAGDFRKARELDLLAQSRRRLVLGETHPGTLWSGAQLGRDLRDAGDYRQSVELLQQVCEQLRNIWGPDAKATLNAQVNLAASLRWHGRPDAARALLESVVERLFETVGPNTLDSLAARHSRAINHIVLGESSLATTELTDVYRAYADSLGQDHPYTLLCANNLASVTDDVAAAHQLARQAATRLATALDQDHPHTLWAAANLAIFTGEDGDLPAAIDTLQAVIIRLKGTLGDDHPTTLITAANLALTEHRHGKPGALAQMAHFTERLAARIGVDHPMVRTALSETFVHLLIDPHPLT